MPYPSTAREFALIVAGGKGTRFGSDIPKQFVRLGGRPVLLHTLDAFCRYNDRIQIILVLPSEHIPLWWDLARTYAFTRPVIVQEGGATRFQSVRNGLRHVTGDGFVAIHDGVRPLVSERIIARSFQLASQHGAAIAATSLKESLRMISNASQDKTQAVDRSRFRSVQTPQTFAIDLISKAYEIAEENSLTDDASVAEKAGFEVCLFEGDHTNIKITGPEDLVIAEALLASRKKS